eukprot:jgi/Ulvmu1/12592/UM092_0022.1
MLNVPEFARHPYIWMRYFTEVGEIQAMSARPQQTSPSHAMHARHIPDAAQLPQHAAAAHSSVPPWLLNSGDLAAAWRRRMQQVTLGTGGRAVVTSARELQDAVADGVLYIEVQAHLDFTDVEPLPDAANNLLLRADPGRVNAIWGNCTDAPRPDFLSGLTPQPRLLPLEAGQCLVITDMDLLRADGELWLHNLSLRLLSTRREPGPPVLVEAFGGDPAMRLTATARRAAEAEAAALSPSAAAAAAEAEEERRAALWMTRVAIQGDGVAPARGVRVGNADLYAEGCTFSSLGVGEETALISGRTASASFVNCTFTAAPPPAESAAPPVIAATGGADVRLERCAFAPISPPPGGSGPAVLAAADGALYFSDVRRAVTAAPDDGDGAAALTPAAGEEVGETFPLDDAPVPPIFLRGGDEWLLDTQQESGLLGPSLSDAPRSALPPLLSPAAGSIPPTPTAVSPGDATPSPAQPQPSPASTPSGAPSPAPNPTAEPAAANSSAALPPVGTPQTNDATATAGAESAAIGMQGAPGGGMVAVPPPASSGGGRLGEGHLAAIASAVFAFVVLAGLAAALIVVRRRQQRRAAAAAVIAKFTQYGPDTTASFMAPGRLPFFDPQTAVLVAAGRSDSSGFAPTTHDPSTGSTLPSVLHNPSFTTETHNISNQLDSRSTQRIAPRPPVAQLPMHALQAVKVAGAGASLAPIVSVERSTPSAEPSMGRSSGVTHSYGEGSWSETLPDTGSFAPRPPPHGKGDSGKPRLASTLVPGTFTVGERPTLADNASLRTRIDYIQYQLDCFEPGSEVLPGYRMCGGGPGQRFVGGQAIVQTVRHELSSTDYVLKAFATSAAFRAEAALYLDEGQPLGAFLPCMRAILDNTDRRARDPHGHIMPPCIVMEKGESLDLWRERAAPDQPLVYAVLLHVAKRLQGLHAAGYVHRDLKPANVMWLPRENRWTLIDFGCAAAAGSAASLAFTLHYAAPEVVAAWQAGEARVLVTPALDAWSLGIMAVELLWGQPIFPPKTLQDQAVSQILAEAGAVMPWEEGAPDRDRILAALGIFKPPVLALLSRSAPRRPAMQQFCSLCQSALSGSTDNPSD